MTSSVREKFFKPEEEDDFTSAGWFDSLAGGDESCFSSFKIPLKVVCVICSKQDESNKIENRSCSIPFVLWIIQHISCLFIK